MLSLSKYGGQRPLRVYFDRLSMTALIVRLTFVIQQVFLIAIDRFLDLQSFQILRRINSMGFQFGFGYFYAVAIFYPA